jgi:uncharacterized protein (TIGR00725 family)
MGITGVCGARHGVEYIDAVMVRSRVPLTPDVNADNQILGEYERFLECTQLDQLRPEQNIRFTIAGGYEQLIEHIAVHRYFMGIDERRGVSEEEAVTHWYDTVYMPVVEVIREQNVLADFPGRTEADLYVWLMDHLHYLRESHGDVDPAQAAQEFAQEFSERLVQKLIRTVAQAIDAIGEAEAPLPGLAAGPNQAVNAARGQPALAGRPGWSVASGSDEMPVVTIFGGNAIEVDDTGYREAFELGRRLAQAGYAVATGGYYGTMEAASRGAKEGGAHVIGVTTGRFDDRGLKPNPWVDEEIKFPALFQRFATGDVLRRARILARRVGTLSECALVEPPSGCRDAAQTAGTRRGRTGGKSWRPTCASPLSRT